VIRRASDTASLEERTFVDAPVEAEAYKTLVSFTVAQHGAPGALADCLAVFKKHEISLTSINSRPSGEASWHYVFFVEFKGRKRAEGQGGVVNAALGDLGAVAKDWRWLGSFEDAAGYAQWLCVKERCLGYGAVNAYKDAGHHGMARGFNIRGIKMVD
jgi:prephenate dehydratase